MVAALGGRRLTALVLLLVGVWCASCARERRTSDATTGAETTAALTERSGSLDAAFAASSRRAGVPRDLLVAIAVVERGLWLPRERVDIDIDNAVPAAGPLQLRHGKLDTLRRGAELMGTTELALRKDADLALEAGALVLAELGSKTGAEPADLASFRDAVEEMGGFADAAHRGDYVHRVFATLARGGRFAARDGETITLAPHALPPTLTLDVSAGLRTLAQAQYPEAEWIPTSCEDKCTEGRDDFDVELIVIHDTEGSWTASVATLQNDPAKSVQYIIDVDGRVGQFVSEETTAWHAGNFNVNQRSIGIEHVGWATKPFPEALYASSARLVDHLATKYDLPRDRAHIIGHDQVPNGKRLAQGAPPCSDSPRDCQDSREYGGANGHTDPGIWDWATYMPRFGGRAKCNDAIELWRCDHALTRMFRCVSGEIEIESCRSGWSCQARGDRADDVCAPAPPPSGALAAAPAEEGCSTSPGERPGRPLVWTLGALAAGGLFARRRSAGGERRRRASEHHFP